MSTEPTPEALRARYADGLRAEPRELHAACEHSAAARRPVALDQQSVGRLSRMDALQGQARIRAIDAALHRLQADEFGYCRDCGEFIGLRRLDLDPLAQRCMRLHEIAPRTAIRAAPVPRSCWQRPPAARVPRAGC